MKILYDSTVIIVNDFDEMKQFYIKTLNQEIKHDFGNCIVLNNGIALWQLRDEYPLAMKIGHRFHKYGNKNLEICFVTENIQEVEQELETLKVRFLHKIEEESWGQLTIRFYDPENNLIEIGESIPCFVRRIYNTGMSYAEVAEKTGIDLQYIKEILKA